MLIDYSNLKEKIKKLIESEVQQIIVTGEAGVGKTMLSKEALEELYGMDNVEIVNMNGQTDTTDLLGKYVLKERMQWIDGVLTRAVRRQKHLLIQEANAAPPEILLSLHSLFDDLRYLEITATSEKLNYEKDRVVIITCNLDYLGTEEFNRAFLDRFAIIQVPLPDLSSWEKIVSLEIQDKELITLLGKAFYGLNENCENTGEFISVRQARRFLKVLNKAGRTLAVATLNAPINVKFTLDDLLMQKGVR